MPGSVTIILTPSTTPPIWSCQPPPVVRACSSRSTLWNSSRGDNCLPIARPSAATITAPMMLEVPSPLPLGIAASVVSSMPPPKASRVFLRLFFPVAAAVRRQTGKDHRGFRQGEAARRLAVIHQVFELAHLDPHAQIDRADPNHRLVDHPHVGLNRRLAVEIDRRRS